MYENYDDHEIKLAQEFAHALDDYDSIPYHLDNARKFKESFLRRQLKIVLAMADEDIDKSRAAYFVWRVKHYRTNDDYRS